MADWRDIHIDQNQRMAQIMLKQQGEVNQMRAEIASLTTERDQLRADHDRLRRDLGEAAAVRTKLTEQVEALCVEQDRLRESLAEARTWRGVQAFIDEQYPVSVFPVEPDSEQRDDGARILSLLRHLDEALRVVDMHHWSLPASLAAERKQAARLADLEAKAKAWATAERNDDEFEFDIQRAKVALLTAIDAVVPHGQTALRDAVVEAVREFHKPTLQTVEWFHDQTGKGEALCCPSCRPEDPTDWHPPLGEAGIEPEGFVPGYVLSPCPTLAAVDALEAGAVPDVS